MQFRNLMYQILCRTNPKCVIKTETPLREDVIKEGLSTAEALSNAPVSSNNYFVVPKLL